MLNINLNELIIRRGGKYFSVVNIDDKKPLLICLFIILFSIFSFFLHRTDLVISFIRQSIKVLGNFGIKAFSSFKSPTVILFFLFYFSYIIYCSLTLNFHCDELKTYYSFIEPNILRAIATYPLPNNHVLFSLLSQFTTVSSYVLGAALGLRVLPIIISVLTWIVSYQFVNRYYGKIALPVTTLSMIAFTSIQYSFSARGYGLVILFSIICFYAATNIINRDDKKDWAIFIVSAILGAYTIPSFLYPFVTFNVYILFFKPKKIFILIKSNIIIGIGVFILYSPILFIEGFGALSSNIYVAPLSRLEVLTRLANYIFFLPKYLFGIKNIFFYSLLIIGFVYSIFTKQWKIIWMYIIFTFMVPCLLILHSVIPFERVFVYCNFIFVFLILAPFAKLINNHKNIYNILLLFVLSLTIISFIKFPKPYDDSYSEIGSQNKKITDQLLKKDISFCLESSVLSIYTLADYLNFESMNKNLNNVIIDVIVENDTATMKYKDTSKYDYYITSHLDTIQRINKDKFTEFLFVKELNLIIYKKK